MSITEEIRQEIAKGRTNSEIAEWLGCSTQLAADERRHMRLRASRVDLGLNRAQMRKEVRLMIEAGKRNVDTALALGCSESMVAKLRQKMKLEQSK